MGAGASRVRQGQPTAEWSPGGVDCAEPWSLRTGSHGLESAAVGVSFMVWYDPMVLVVLSNV